MMTRFLRIIAWAGGILALAAAPVLAQTAPPATQPPALVAQGAPGSAAGGSAASEGSDSTPAACLSWIFNPYGNPPSLAACPPGRLSRLEIGPSPLAPSPSGASGSFGSGWVAPR